MFQVFAVLPGTEHYDELYGFGHEERTSPLQNGRPVPGSNRWSLQATPRTPRKRTRSHKPPPVVGSGTALLRNPPSTFNRRWPLRRNDRAPGLHHEDRRHHQHVPPLL
uniref:(northern house mosquito) hypothetical protein n=1 Tax=Culex pipiens TaxID=7175 RepID=A0A8D8CAE6_CULPI